MIDFHAHVTLSEMPGYIKGWKTTVIKLTALDTSQTDYMLTKHYRLGVKGFNTVDDIIADIKLVENKHNALRVKLEQDSGFTMPASNNNYVEVHVNCSGADLITDPTWARSSNAFADEPNAFFLTKRFYSGNVDSIKQLVETELSTVVVNEIKIEQIIMDSNKQHDAWWAN